MAVFSVIGIGTFLLTPILAIVTLLSLRAIYNLHFHRLSSQFPGPWYTAVSSLPLAIISYRRREPEWIQNPAYKYGSKFLSTTCLPTNVTDSEKLIALSALHLTFWFSCVQKTCGKYMLTPSATPNLNSITLVFWVPNSFSVPCLQTNIESHELHLEGNQHVLSKYVR